MTKPRQKRFTAAVTDAQRAMMQAMIDQIDAQIGRNRADIATLRQQRHLITKAMKTL